jgi:hypothetical protein
VIPPGTGWNRRPTASPTPLAFLLNPIDVVPGDYNDNSVVDTADYTVWRDTFSQEGPDLAADGNGDESVDEVDYQTWTSNFGLGENAIETSKLATVPEPTGMMIALVALMMILIRRPAQIYQFAPRR